MFRKTPCLGCFTYFSILCVSFATLCILKFPINTYENPRYGNHLLLFKLDLQSSIEDLGLVIQGLGIKDFRKSRTFGCAALSLRNYMRMDSENAFSAENVVNEYSADRLSKIFFEYGEEKYSRKILHK